MKKILTLLSTLALAFTIAGCGKKARTITTEANYEYFDSLKEVSDITISNVPKQIQIGYITQANIILDIKYVDGSKDEKLITESFFPKSYYSELLTEGNKYFDFVYKEKHIPLKFKLVKAKVPMTYKVDFTNELGKVIETKYVKYLQSVKCSKSGVINDYFKDGYYYKFTGTFDHDLDYVYDNFTANPIFDKFKSANYETVYYQNAATLDVIDTYNVGDTYHSLVYLGRVEDFVVTPLHYTYNRTTYEAINKPYIKESQVEAFYVNICMKLKDLIHRCYVHGSDNAYLDGMTLDSTELLDFDLSKESSYSCHDFDMMLPDAFVGDLSLTGYNIPSIPKERGDGECYSFKSIFSKESASLHSAEYNIDNPTEYFDFTQDYYLGYYDLNFVLDIDLYLDVTYTATETNGKYTVNLEGTKIAATFIEGTGRFELNYSSTNTFEYYGNKFNLQNAMLAATLVNELQKG